MRIMKNLTFSVTFLLVLNGCSSYKLQDYADEYFDQKPSSSSVSSKSTQSSDSTNEYEDVWREFDEASPSPKHETNSADLKQEALQAEVVTGYKSKASYDTPRDALQAISPTPTYEPSNQNGFLQKTYDDFVEKEWFPDVESDDEIAEKYGDEDRSFTLQEYVDKWSKYVDKHQAPEWESHVKQVDEMPVIGKQK
jgi:hypothetical protein